MLRLQAYRFQLKPNGEQERKMRQFAGGRKSTSVDNAVSFTNPLSGELPGTANARHPALMSAMLSSAGLNATGGNGE
jgi:hypothetical protein